MTKVYIFEYGIWDDHKHMDVFATEASANRALKEELSKAIESEGKTTEKEIYDMGYWFSVTDWNIKD